MVEHGTQLPMFPGVEGEGSPRDQILFHVIEMQAEGLRLMAEHVHLLQNELGQHNGHASPKAQRPSAKRAHVPHDPRFRVWKTFRAYFVELERRHRLNHGLAPDAPLSKTLLCTDSGALVPRTLTRTMVETYGLDAEAWPPSTWPEVLPEDK